MIIPKDCQSSAGSMQAMSPSLLILVYSLATNQRDVMTFLQQCRPHQAYVLQTLTTNSKTLKKNLQAEELSLLASLVNKLEGKKIPLSLQSKVLQKLRQGKNHFLRLLGEMLLASVAGNQVWLKRALLELARLNPEEVMFELYADSNLNSQEIILKAARFIITNSKDDTLRVRLALMLSILSDPAMDDLSLFGPVKFPTLQALRKLVEEDGLNAIPFWYFVLLTRASQLEAQVYLESNLEKITTMKDFTWALSMMAMPSKFIKPKYYAWLTELTKEKSPYQQIILLRLLQHDGTKKEMEKLNPSISLPLFHLQRRYYLDLLREDFSPPYLIHQLLMLNDTSLEAVDIKRAIQP